MAQGCLALAKSEASITEGKAGGICKQRSRSTKSVPRVVAAEQRRRPLHLEHEAMTAHHEATLVQTARVRQ